MSDTHAHPPAELVVRNFLGVRQADIALTGINLISGRNGAGKSSLLEAGGCALRQSPWARGSKTKTSGKSILRRGADAGSVNISRGTARVQITYPAAEIEQVGRPVAAVTLLASGQGSFLALTADDRIRETQARLEAHPVRADIYSFLAEHEGGKPMLAVKTDVERRRTLLDDATDALLERVGASGWDAVYKAAREAATRLKGRWEQVTGTKFGTQKAATWLPRTLVPGEEYHLDRQKAAIATEERALEALLVVKGVAEEEERALREEADKLPRLEADETALVGRMEEIERKMTAVTQAINAADAPIDRNTLIRCLKCQTYHRWVPVSTGRAAESIGNGRVLEIVTLPAPADEDAQAKAAQALEEEITGLRAASRAIAEQRVALRRDLTAAKAAMTKLQQAAGQPVRDDAAVEAQRGRVTQARLIAEAIEAHHQAQAIFQEFSQQQAIVDCLAPDGVRQAVLARKMEAFRGELQHISELAGFEPVDMDDHMAVTYGERPAELLSRSERWRVDLVFAAAFATREGNDILIVDELDLLDPESRPGVLQMLKKMGMNALVGMTARDAGQVPVLRKFGLGRSWWMKAGELQEIVA